MKVSGLLLIVALLMSFAVQVQADEHNRGFDREEVPIKFSDADEAAWAKEYIGKMQSKNVIKGTGKGTFEPNDDVSRAAAIVMAVRLLDLEDEAEAKPDDVSLHFQDEEQIPSWARGHVAVALENDLFNTTDQSFNPYEPAKRIWIAELLVKSLGLEDDALDQMNDIPEFTDVDKIPAGAIGYVNVAADEDLTTGYEDGTFKPNKNVSRAEMTAFLERTNSDLLDQSGARTLQGTVTDVSFDEEMGSISLNVNGESFTFDLTSELEVQFEDRLIKADQLRADDKVTLVVQDESVVEARLLNEKTSDSNESSGLIELEVEYERDDTEYELEYDNKKGESEAELEDEFNGVEAEGEEAFAIVEALGLTQDMSRDAILERVMNELDVQDDDFDELKIEAKFANGHKVEVKREPNVDIPDDVTGDLADIESFDLDVELFDGEDQSYDYELDDGDIEEDVKRDGEEVEGNEALQAVSTLVNDVSLTEEMSDEEVREAILATLSIDSENVSELELEVEYLDGYKVKVEFEQEADQPEESRDGQIAEFKLDAELNNDKAYEYSMEQDDGDIEYEYSDETDSDETELEGAEAQEKVNQLLDQLQLSAEMTQDQLKKAALTALSIDEEDVEELEISVSFVNGESIEVEIEEED
ncbi:YusW family protein [Alkalibacillus flavidus]